MVIISSSGMATAGRIQHHLANNVGNPINTVVIVSWQAPGTPGRRLVDREPRIRFFGDEFDVRCRIEVINGLSAHADQAGLADYAGAMAKTVKGVFLVHGEPAPAFALAEVLHERGVNNVAVPQLDDTFVLE
jgi:metallo-beta-lactamase family protein